MPTISQCPDCHGWISFFQGTLDAQSHEDWLAHLDSCPACEELVSGLEQGLGRIRPSSQHPAASDSGDGPTAQEIESSWIDGLHRPPVISGLTDFEVIGQGSMSVVFRARENELDRLVAVKLFRSANHRFTSSTRALREAKTLARLDHPNIVRIYRWGLTGGTPYIVMEWVPQGNLQSRIDRELPSEREAAAIVRDLARAVGESHAIGIVHRDLKPHNVLLSPSDSGDTWIPKLADFSLARPDDSTLTQTDVVAGTPSYMAPEQTGLFPQAGPIGPATDIHGLGAILYAMLTGDAPFQGRTSWDVLVQAARSTPIPIQKLRPAVSRDLCIIAEKCLNQWPHHRYTSAEELADDLTRFLDGHPIHARAATLVERSRMWVRRHPLATTGIACGLLALMGGLAGTAYHLVSLSHANQRLEKSAEATTAALESEKKARLQSMQTMMTMIQKTLDRAVTQGKPLDETDRDTLLNIRNQLQSWPINPAEAQLNLVFKAESLLKLAQIFCKIDRNQEAFNCFEAGLAACDEARERQIDHPHVNSYRLKLLNEYHLQLDKLGRHAEAEAISRKTIAELESLQSQGQIYQTILPTQYMKLALNLCQMGKHDESAAAVAKARQLFQVQRERNPSDRIVRHTEMIGLLAIACIHATKKNWEEALPQFEEVLAAAEKALNDFPDGEPDIPQVKTLALGGIATCLQEQNKLEPALVAAWDNIRWSKSVFMKRPKNPLARDRVALAIIQLSEIALALGRPQEAEDELKRLLEKMDRIVALEPTNFRLANFYFAAMTAYADLLSATNRAAAALKTCDRQMELLAPWQKHHERAQDLAKRTSDCQRASASALLKLGDWAEASNRIELALAMCVPEQREKMMALRDEILLQGPNNEVGNPESPDN